MPAEIRILLLADSHLGFDLPVTARGTRRRRGHDFLANYARALEPALANRVDVVVHCGDVFDRPVVTPSLAYQALQPLARVADGGIPVFIVPGNHERSILPHSRFARHSGVHVFDRARTFVVDVRGTTLSVAGFPYERRSVRTRFPELLRECEATREPASVRLLCMHQCVEGATVGPGDFTFRSAPDVIRGRDIPGCFDAVLSGHIHRHQVLTTDLESRPLAAPVLYPGSIERTSLAELGEPKGCMVLRAPVGGPLRWDFRPLPARPMLVKPLAGGRGRNYLEAAVIAAIRAAPADAVLRLRVSGALTASELRVLSARRLREVAPGTMNVEVTLTDVVRRYDRSRVRPGARASGRGRTAGEPEQQLQLGWPE